MRPSITNILKAKSAKQTTWISTRQSFRGSTIRNLFLSKFNAWNFESKQDNAAEQLKQTKLKLKHWNSWWCFVRPGFSINRSHSCGATYQAELVKTQNGIPTSQHQSVEIHVWLGKMLRGPEQPSLIRSRVVASSWIKDNPMFHTQMALCSHCEIRLVIKAKIHCERLKKRDNDSCGGGEHNLQWAIPSLHVYFVTGKVSKACDRCLYVILDILPMLNECCLLQAFA